MIRFFLLFFLVILFSDIIAVEPDTLFLKDNDSLDFYSLAKKSIILEDKEHKFTFKDIENPSPEILAKFYPLKDDIPNLDFTASSYWVKFVVHNSSSSERNFLLEVARPVTNVANLYICYSNGFISENKNGDNILFDKRMVKHRKLIFPIRFQPGEEQTFFLELVSDGELLTLPIKLWTPDAFRNNDYYEQMIFGMYYGIILFVVIFYSFFYVALRGRLFLYYVLYVLSLFFLQFSLDGLTFQFLCPTSIWLGNHMVLISACFSIIFCIKYAQEFLEIEERFPRINQIFKIFLGLTFIFLFISFTSGKLYSTGFPSLNALVLVVFFLIIVTIISSYKKRYSVSGFFTAAFVSVIVGAVIFILGNFHVIQYSIFTEHGIKYGSLLEVVLLSVSMVNKYRENEQEKEKAKMEMLKVARENERLVREQNIILEQKVKDRTAEVVKQKEIIEEKNKDITDSINYAKRIQQAVLIPKKNIYAALQNSFILFKPKDIVSGDFYWYHEIQNHESMMNGERTLFIAAVDCTGHGVPGAFMSLIGLEKLDEAIKQSSDPGEILGILNRSIKELLHQYDTADSTRDGMDIALVKIEAGRRETEDRSQELEDKGKEAEDRLPIGNCKIEFAGANRPLYIVRKKQTGVELEEIKPTNKPIAGGQTLENQKYDLHKIILNVGDSFYIFSDGFHDQFGGKRGKRMMTQNFKNLLISIQNYSILEQEEVLNKFIEEWKSYPNPIDNGKPNEQLDDILVIGVQV